MQGHVGMMLGQGSACVAPAAAAVLCPSFAGVQIGGEGGARPDEIGESSAAGHGNGQVRSLTSEGALRCPPLHPGTGRWRCSRHGLGGPGSAQRRARDSA